MIGPGEKQVRGGLFYTKEAVAGSWGGGGVMI